MLGEKVLMMKYKKLDKRNAAVLNEPCSWACLLKDKRNMIIEESVLIQK